MFRFKLLFICFSAIYHFMRNSIRAELHQGCCLLASNCMLRELFWFIHMPLEGEERKRRNRNGTWIEWDLNNASLIHLSSWTMLGISSPSSHSPKSTPRIIRFRYSARFLLRKMSMMKITRFHLSNTSAAYRWRWIWNRFRMQRSKCVTSSVASDKLRTRSVVYVFMLF